MLLACYIPLSPELQFCWLKSFARQDNSAFLIGSNFSPSKVFFIFQLFFFL